MIARTDHEVAKSDKNITFYGGFNVSLRRLSPGKSHGSQCPGITSIQSLPD